MSRVIVVMRSVASVGWVLVLGGCLGYRAPSVVVQEAVMTEESEEAVRFDIALDLENPNTEGLELVEFEYTVSVDGSSVYRGKRAAEATLSAGRGKRLTLPVVVRYDRAGWSRGARPAEAGWSVRGSMLYVTPGEIAEILLDTGVRKPRVGFSGSGRVLLRVEEEGGG